MGLYHPIETLSATPGKVSVVEPFNDDKIVPRMIKAYQHSEEQQLGNSMWQRFFYNFAAPIDTVFKSGQIDQAAQILREPGSNNLFYGIDNLSYCLLWWLNNERGAHGYATDCLDVLISFAELSGCIENNPDADNSSAPLSADQVIRAIKKKFGDQITFPNPYPNEQGLQSSYGVISERVPQALYQAWKIKELVKGIPNPRVLEIGAGVGRTAFYARQLGIADYTIVDLPITSLASGYFLARSIGENNILFSGETGLNMEQKIKMMTPQEYFTSSNKYDLIVNVDSLIEMDVNIALMYLNKIKQDSSMFLSINNELGAFSFNQLIWKIDNIKKVERLDYPIRDTYFEEVVYFVKND